MNSIIEIIKICDRHADRLNWAITALQDHFPLSANSLENLSDEETKKLRELPHPENV